MKTKRMSRKRKSLRRTGNRRSPSIMTKTQSTWSWWRYGSSQAITIEEMLTEPPALHNAGFDHWTTTPVTPHLPQIYRHTLSGFGMSWSFVNRASPLLSRTSTTTAQSFLLSENDLRLTSNSWHRCCASLTFLKKNERSSRGGTRFYDSRSINCERTLMH